MDYFEETKYAICGRNYITKDNRPHLLWSLFTTAKVNGVVKADAKVCFNKLEKELLGDVKRIPKDKREFIINITKRDILDAFFGVYGTEVVEAVPERKVEKVIEEETYEIDFSNILTDEYAKRKGIVQGPLLEERLDKDFCAKIGFKQ